MRMILAAAAFSLVASSASAEIWFVREGPCGEWQSRWDVTQEQAGVWVGEIEHYHVGGPCARGTGQTLRSEVRAVITGDNLFAIRKEREFVCTHFARIREREGRGVTVCENGPRSTFNVRFRASPDRQLREPADDLLEEDGGQGRRFRERSLDDWVGRR